MQFIFFLWDSFVAFLASFYQQQLFEILGIIAALWIIHRFARVVIERTVRRIIVRREGMTAKEERQREDTLIRIVGGATSVIVWLVAVMFVVNTFGVPISPIITATGVVGVAFGFGAQYLVRDLITGTFIILENQYRVGDIVCFDDACGKVEDISLRKTTLRNLEGAVFHVPHGSITRVENRSQEFSRLKIDMPIAYAADIDHVAKVIDRVGEEMVNDPEWKESFISAPKFLRINAFSDNGMVIRILGETMPGNQFTLAGEFRKRLKKAFDKEGIKIPVPQREVYTITHT